MEIDLNELELDNIAEWPLAAKVGVIVFFGLAIIFLGYWLDIKRQIQLLDSAAKSEIQLRDTFESKQHKAANLDGYKKQMVTMKESFGILLRQLPEKTEVPGLLEDISHQGLATGLEFRSIRLQPEQEIDFYVELPIEISVVGQYHQFAEFVSNVAALPRIVTLHDFMIRDIEGTKNSDQLVMNITAKTYRYTADGDDE